MPRFWRLAALLSLCVAGCGGREPAPPQSVIPARDILEVDRALTISASPGGELWICAMDGRSYASRDWNQTWCQAILPEHACRNGTCLWFFNESR